MTTALDRPTAVAVSRRAMRWRTPALVGLLGLAISVIGAWVPSVWYDEAATITSSTRSWTQLWAELGTVDLVHGLYYAGMHVWFDLVGYTPVTLRLPSALAIGAAASLIVVLGRQLSRDRLGMIAGLVFCILPRTTWAGTEGRSYALTALLAVALTVVLVAGRRAPAARVRLWWIAYGLLAIVAIATFVYLAFVVAAHALTVLWWMRADPHLQRRTRTWFLAAAGAGVVTVPFVLAASGQSGQVLWLGDIGPQTVLPVFREQWFMSSLPFAIAGWAAMALGTVALMRTSQGRGIAALAVPAALLPTVLLLVATVAVTPLYNPRYLTLSLPFVALLIGAAIDALPRRRAIAIALVAALALAVPPIIEQRSPLSKENTDWGAVAALIGDERAAAGATSSTAIIYGTVQNHPRATSRVISYSYPDAFAGTTDVTIATPAAESGRLWETQNPLIDSLDKLNGVDVVYLLTSRARDDTGPVTAVIDDRGWRATEDTVIGDVRIVRYER